MEINFEPLRSLPQASSAVGDETAVSKLLQELQEVRDEAVATKDQLDSYKESSRRLQEELDVCNSTLDNSDNRY